MPARRLNNAEYDHSIAELTGVDLRPTRNFPLDPANQAGFDNSAESLALSPALVKKYLEAAREVANHLVLQPEGFTFAPHPVIADTDRDKWAVFRIVDFYRRQPTDLADYFEAAWRFRYRTRLGLGNASLERIASDAKISPKYLARIWSALQHPGETVGPMAWVQAEWRALPEPGPRSAIGNTLERCPPGLRTSSRRSECSALTTGARCGQLARPAHPRRLTNTGALEEPTNGRQPTARGSRCVVVDGRTTSWDKLGRTDCSKDQHPGSGSPAKARRPYPSAHAQSRAARRRLSGAHLGDP